MSEKEEDVILVENSETVKEIRRILKYLNKHGVYPTPSAVIDASIKLTRRLGAGDWTFVCYMRGEERRRKEEE